jgi:UDP:flavonoid glycosyltransferase YjiC (YdhE family)
VTVADDRTVRNVLDLPGAETLGRLAGAVTSVLNDSSYRREARRIAEAMRLLPPVDESVQFLEEAAAQHGRK